MTAIKAVEKTGAITTAAAILLSATRRLCVMQTQSPENKLQSADIGEKTLQEVYGKEHVNLIFIGHVDAGKSTLGGSLLNVTGMVDERTLEKYVPARC
jgi:peptide chain release factor subunit 3